ncbi:hypothetical protein L1987_10905 [Smallanthus sonchifolius]|uniref:Uncharacterized protein n=1 Tax=Smallanthus sonchifolius TaxID=185202 RepID=A0ACB9JAE9_9ASTR|nr:hypothetical protein L1987_10905 [Smallanthus sonchifolius]
MSNELFSLGWRISREFQLAISYQLAAILLDTENLTSPECTSKDRYMSTLLLNETDRFGCNDRAKSLALAVSGEARQLEELTNFQPEKGAAI